MRQIDKLSSNEPTLHQGWPQLDPANLMQGLRDFLLFVFILEFIFSVLW